MTGQSQSKQGDVRFDILIVRAEGVREGDWVRWPAESQTIRLITYVHQESEDVYLHSEYDAYEYELCHHQPVTIWRAKQGEGRA